jgi:bifunctional UDP-N-acetylglucosamine pyrophosphorylase/glucosamine-1-phosphate N-acetyltransferase
LSTSTAVILAAGHGKRMRSTLPKGLHRLAGRTMLDYVVGAVRGAGVGRVVVVVGHGAEEVERNLPPGAEAVRQADQLGTADAVLSARALLQDDRSTTDVVVAYGDCPLLTDSLFRDLIEWRRQTGSTIALVVTSAADPKGYGRVIRDADGRVRSIVEEAAATEAERSVREINAGVYSFAADWLWNALPRVQPAPTGEYYLTDLVAMAMRANRLVQSIEAPLDVTSGVNDRVQLARADRMLRDRIRDRLMQSGVTLIDPAAIYIDDQVSIGPDTVIYPGSVIEGATTIGSDCRIGPHSHIVGSQIGDNVVIAQSMVDRAIVADRVSIGPFSHLRSGAHILAGAEIGNYAEVKQSTIGIGTRMHHFSYIGDAEIGDNVNIGAGTITCNYDAETGKKSRTIVEREASLGSDTLLVAPVRIGEAALTGAGSVVTTDVEPRSVVVGVPARRLRERRLRDTKRNT